MPLPYSSAANLPLGFGTVTISNVAYVIEARDIAKLAVRKITRTDANGDPAAFQLREDFLVGSLTLQRANVATALPDAGVTFSYSHDGGTATNFVTGATKIVPSKDAFDLFEVEVHKVYP